MTIRFIIKSQADCQSRNCHRREVAKRRVPVYVRIRDGRNIDFIARTPICVYPKWWNKVREEVNSSCACPKEERNAVNMSIIDLRNYLVHNYIDDRIKDRISTNWLSVQLDRFYYRSKDEKISAQCQNYVFKHKILISH